MGSAANWLWHDYVAKGTHLLTAMRKAAGKTGHVWDKAESLSPFNVSDIRDPGYDRLKEDVP